CPTPSDLKNNNGSRICAQLYKDNSPYYEQCCAGDVLVVEPGADVPYMPRGWPAQTSSLVVGSRCELIVWSKAGKKGKKKTFGA
ncbi:SYCN protein, partial [Galbula dea]|nr:SYCN protein [Galbula dea]